MLIKGVLLGISIAAPVGPVGILCIQRTLKKGFSSGFFSGLGAASADLIYGALAAFGALWLGSAIENIQTPLRLVGGIVLILLGIRGFVQKEERAAEIRERKGYFGDYLSTFLLTLTNPITILSFTAVYASLGLNEGGGNLGQMMWLVVGVFSGSALWWLFLSALVAFLREKIPPTFYRIINLAAGLMLVAFGISIILGLF